MPITILRQSATLNTLTEDGPVARPLSAPAAVAKSHEVPLEGQGENRTGIWEVSIGRFERQLANSEVMHILSGECTFTPTGGETLEIRSGDTLFFPANTEGVWNVTSPIRKVYVVMAA
ncbi:cupin [Robbsia andropogonis]|uniref:Cupin n=1 Tax=Robbsia andropogonis TaxID=28092 RepID=A0A0F5K189_9BURK|nr:cupin domain-containing protein [Robbsia andropogonis]KKB63685.1 cupin [Robbsia andropogonis]